MALFGVAKESNVEFFQAELWKNRIGEMQRANWRDVSVARLAELRIVRGVDWVTRACSDLRRRGSIKKK